MQNPLTLILDQEQANLIFIMLISIPLCYLLSLLNNKYLFLGLSLTLTLSFQSFLFPTQKYFLWIQQQVVYCIVRFAPRKLVGHIVLVQSFLVLAVVQIRRIYISYGQNGVDITGILMMQVFNYVGMAYNYSNGAKDPAELTDDQIKRRIINPPEYLTYLGYIMFPAACLVGPVYEYSDFDQYLNRKGDYQTIPSPLSAVLSELGIFVGSVAVYGLTSKFTLAYVTTPGFAEEALWYKFIYIVINITHIELKYISAWSLGMMSMRASGFTYNPSKNIKDKEGKVLKYDFGKVEQNSIYNFYFQPSIKRKAQSWNVSVQIALKRYIYELVYNPKIQRDQKQRKKVQSRAQYITLIVSALWHGFYLGYFITFTHWVFCIQISQEIFRVRKNPQSWLGKLWSKYEFWCNILQNMWTTFALTYYGMAIHLMIWSRIKIYLAETYYIPYIALYIIFFLIVKMKVLSPRTPKQDKKPQEIKGKSE